MKQILTSILVFGLVTGCTQLSVKPKPKSVEASVPSSGQLRPTARPTTLNTSVPAVPAAARTVEDFDTTTPEQRAAAVIDAPDLEKNLGLTIASLGSASEPGFWLKTPLVSVPTKGRVEYSANGKSVQVDLIPIDGPKTAGSRMSLAALRLIEAPLTGLPEVRVFSN